MTKANPKVDGGRPEWQALIAEVEEKMRALSVALAELQVALRRIAASEAAAQANDPAPAADAAPAAVAPARGENAEAAPQPASQPPVAAGTAVVMPAAGPSVAAAQPEAKEPEQRKPPPSKREAAVGAWWNLPVQEGVLPLAHEESAPLPVAPEETDPAREAVRRAVEQARAELAAGVLKAEPGAAAPEEAPVTPVQAIEGDEAASEAAREAVRRAVEQARAELAAGKLKPQDVLDEGAEYASAQPAGTGEVAAGAETAESPAAVPARPGRFQLPAPEEANVTPLAMVIEDPEGRVELARVFDALTRLDCAQASLLNYTTHSVTVSLSPGSQWPTPEAIAAAVEEAFGRSCHVAEEGVRISVRVGERRKRGAA